MYDHNKEDVKGENNVPVKNGKLKGSSSNYIVMCHIKLLYCKIFGQGYFILWILFYLVGFHLSIGLIKPIKDGCHSSSQTHSAHQI